MIQFIIFLLHIYVVFTHETYVEFDFLKCDLHIVLEETHRESCPALLVTAMSFLLNAEGAFSKMWLKTACRLMRETDGYLTSSECLPKFLRSTTGRIPPHRGV